MRTIMISFPGHANLDLVKEQLKKVFDIEDAKVDSEEFEYVCLFLPRHVVEEKGIDTDIIDLLSDSFKDRNLSMPLEKYPDYETCMKKLDAEKDKWINMVDVMYVLSVDIAPGVAKEIEIASNGKVKIILYGSTDQMACV